MAERSLSFVANRILEDIKKMRSLGVASQNLLEGLGETISELAPLLLDAEMKSFYDEGLKVWLMDLGEVLSDADNLLDNLSAAALQRKLMTTTQRMTRAMKQVWRTTFSSTSPNSTIASDQLSKILKIKQIKKSLHNIASRRHYFFLEERNSTDGKVQVQPGPGDEVYERDDDGKKIVKMLLNQRETQLADEGLVVMVLPIVGMGGLGKTKLAQYVFNDPRVQEHFGKRIWVKGHFEATISVDFNIRKNVEQVPGATEAASVSSEENLSMEQLHQLLRRSSRGQRYLIVLDDVWNEDPYPWFELKDALQFVGARGSAIILTSRSLEVARIVGTIKPYELGPLSEVQSWTLFQGLAFCHQHSQESKSPEMISIGREIARGCNGHPLLLRTIGSLLCHKKTVDEWWFFYEEEFSTIKEIFIQETMLELRYDHLSSPLIHCIAYCSLFPKGHEIDVQALIQLWMAQGFIHPLTSIDRPLEDVGYRYFLDLLDLHVFHQVTVDVWGRVTKCKMVDSMHDLATSAAGEHCLSLDSQSYNEDTHRRASHVSIGFNSSLTREVSAWLKGAEKLRSILFQSSSSAADTGRVADKMLDTIISGCRFLRVLDMHGLGLTNVPSSISKLKYLRYLDLSENEHLTELPDSINELLNLQTLKLSSCFELRKLPRDIGNLVNLRHLAIDGCYNLISLPRGIAGLTNLQTLSQVVLSEDASTRRDQLKQVRKLKNLRGELEIKYLKHGKDEIAMDEKWEVRSLSLEWESHALESDKDEKPLDREIFRDLQELSLKGFRGAALFQPSFPSNLVKLSLRRWVKGKNLSSLSQCTKLKVLVLDEISELEFVENDAVSSGMEFFPTLQELWLTELRTLKGWWGPSLVENQESLPSFPCLSKLVIEDCPMLASMPLFPTLEEGLVLDSTSWDLFQLTVKPKSATAAAAAAEESFPASLDWCKTSSSLECQEYLPPFHCLSKFAIEDCQKSASMLLFPMLEGELAMDSTCWYSSQHTVKPKSATAAAAADEASSSSNIPLSPLSKLKNLCIVGIRGFNDSKAEEIAWNTLQSLKMLKFDSLPELATLPMGLQHISSLKELHVWRSGVMEIPAWIGNLTYLEKLVIRACPNIEKLPEEICRLKYLKTLEIEDCPTLIRRCEKGIGADWLTIQGIEKLQLGRITGR